jgi:hypothetical protein
MCWCTWSRPAWDPLLCSRTTSRRKLVRHLEFPLYAHCVAVCAIRPVRDRLSVTPVGLPFGLPNTRCNYYTYGGNCDMCEDETIGGFTGIYAFANGSLVFEQSENVDGTMQYGLAQFDSPVTVPSMQCGVDNAGCSATGGTCVSGTCYCLPGCSGVDCRSGKPFCSQDSLKCGDSSLSASAE